MREFTNKEKTTIKDAFKVITYAIERTDMTLPREWQKAFKYERKQCTSADWARALVVIEFYRGATQARAVSDIFWLRDGARRAHLLGANFKAYYVDVIKPRSCATRDAWEKIVPLCKAALEALDAVYGSRTSETR